MKLRKLVARYAGRCRGCGGDLSVGDNIRYGGRGLTYHNRDACTGENGAGFDAEGNDDDNPYISDRFARESILRNASGEVIATRNRNGICEDAPCCGCCS